MKTILVPTDFSENAHMAIDYAVEIAGRMKSKILLYNFFRIPVYAGEAPFEPSLIEEMEQESQDQLNLLKVEIMEKNSRVEVDCISASSMNFEVEEICDVAIANNADLIIMGTKGASGLTKALLGSNTAHVIEKAHCPVLAVPENAEFRFIKKIVFATNFEDEDLASIHFITDIAGYFDSDIIICHVADDDVSTHHESLRFENFKTELAKHAPTIKMSFELIAGEDVPERLNEFFIKNKADMIAMSTKKRNLFDRLFDRSLTKEMAYHTDIPLLVFHLH